MFTLCYLIRMGTNHQCPVNSLKNCSYKVVSKSTVGKSALYCTAGVQYLYAPSSVADSIEDKHCHAFVTALHTNTNACH